MKRKKIKIIGIICSIILIFNIYISNTSKTFAMSDVTNILDIWVTAPENGEIKLNNKIEPVLRIIRIVGIIIAVISFAIIGMKITFLSAEEKATYKQTLIPWAFGALLLFSMTTLPSVIYNFVGEENMQVEEEEPTSVVTKEAYYCPIDGKEITEENCPGYEDCQMKQKDAVLGYKCPNPTCGARVWEFRGNLLCPNCGGYYNK